MLPLGTVINGRYRLDRTLGAGGMGVVFEATQLGLERQVAVKVVRGDVAEESRAASRLVREAKNLATLKSPHVAQVIDVGTQDGAPFLVMELLHGCTVSERVARDGALGVEAAVDIVIQACHGLGEAHRHGIVHRDVKPSNLFLADADGGETILKVIDFGISKSRPFESTETATETQTGALLGSPAFMSPEHVRSSSDVDPRTDIWSLGVVLYFMLSAEKPFEADSLLDLMTLIVHEPTPRLRERALTVPAPVEDAVARCLEKKREARFASVGELAHALAPFASPKVRELAMGMSVDAAPFAISTTAPISEDKPRSKGASASVQAATFPEYEVSVTATGTGGLETRDLPVPTTDSPPGAGARSRRRLGVSLAVAALLAGAGGASILRARAHPREPARTSIAPPPSAPPAETTAGSSPPLVRAAAPDVPVSAPPVSPATSPAQARTRPRPRPAPKSADPAAKTRENPGRPPELPRTPD